MSQFFFGGGTHYPTELWGIRIPPLPLKFLAASLREEKMTPGFSFSRQHDLTVWHSLLHFSIENIKIAISDTLHQILMIR